MVHFFEDYWFILLPCILGAAAIYLLLPQGRRLGPFVGGLLGAAALVTAGIYLVRTETVWVESLLFYAFSALAIIGGCLLISQSNPVHAALSFALVVLSTCGLFLLQAAPFLMAATIIVYAGAIIVTFLFVVMLAQQAGLGNADRRSREPFLATLAGFIVIAAILCVLHRTYDTSRLDATLTPLLERTQQAAEANSLKELQAALGDRKAFFGDFRKVVDEETVDNIEQEYVKGDLKKLKDQMTHLHALAVRTRQTLGSLAPDPTKAPPSPFTTPRVRRQQPAAERLPANNVNALGRALFTQHLLSVELAGILLLVASIGAIAIAARRAEGLR